MNKNFVYLEASDNIIKIINLIVKPFILSEHSNEGIGWKISLKNKKEIIEDDTYIYKKIYQNNEPEISLYYSIQKKSIILCNENDIFWQIQNIIRFIRVLLRLQYMESGMKFFHGGMIDYNGDGICFIGEKKSGKTTTILNCSKEKGVSFISNDDVSFLLEQGRLFGYGWPRAINIREDTFEVLNINKNINFSHPISQYSKKKVYCAYPFELEKLVNTQLKNRSYVKYIVFLEFTNEELYTIETLNREEGMKYLDKFSQKVPGKYIDFLWENFNDKKNEMKIPNDIKFLKFQQNFKKIPKGKEILKCITSK